MTFSLQATAAAAALSLSALLAPAQAAQISLPDYQAGKAKLETDFKADKLACKAMTANAKDVCQEEAKAKHKNTMAELEYAHTGKLADEKKMRTVKADSTYAVAREKCDDQTGNAKDVCVQEAKTVHTKALAEVKLAKEVAAAGADASQTQRDADLKLANEKCDALSGDAKNSCQAAAKARFGKS